ncbi:MAG TPA: ribbon-helix-helix domain-containing protein [Candidatus Andersenbacteria bacterium]|nr:ribbon-helix-helix domain-containing protein [Candidatus Andersenbacteria bacterium]
MKSKVITLSIPEKLLKEIDRAAKRENRTRSEFMREGCRKYVEDRVRWQEIKQNMRHSLAKIGINTEEELYDRMTQWRREEAQAQEKKAKGRS